MRLATGRQVLTIMHAGRIARPLTRRADAYRQPPAENSRRWQKIEKQVSGPRRVEDAKHNVLMPMQRTASEGPKGKATWKQLRGRVGLTGMRTLTRYYSIGLLSATLLAPVATLPQDDHRNEQRRKPKTCYRTQGIMMNMHGTTRGPCISHVARGKHEINRFYPAQREISKPTGINHNHSDAVKVEIR